MRAQGLPGAPRQRVLGRGARCWRRQVETRGRLLPLSTLALSKLEDRAGAARVLLPRLVILETTLVRNRGRWLHGSVRVPEKGAVECVRAGAGSERPLRKGQCSESHLLQGQRPSFELMIRLKYHLLFFLTGRLALRM